MFEVNNINNSKKNKFHFVLICDETGIFDAFSLLSLAGGIMLSIYPAISIVILPFVVGFTLLFFSLLLLGFSLEMKNLGIICWGNAAILSVLGVIISFMLIVNPLTSGISLVIIIGVAFILSGVSSIVLAFDLRKVKRIPEKLSSELKHKIAAIKKEIDEVNVAS